jgi:LPXTG-motif cell wall-anchored protein
MNFFHRMINRNFHKIIVSGVLIFAFLLAGAQNGIMVKATVSTSSILIGEPIQLTLEADIPENQPIRFFQVDSLPHFEFLLREPIDTVNTSYGTVLSQVMHITSFDSGRWVIPSFVLDGSIGTDSIPIEVSFSPSPFDASKPYHDIKDIIEVEPEQPQKKPFQWWYVIVGTALLLVLLILLLRRKKKPVVVVEAPPPDPFEVAMKALGNLHRDKKDAKDYYSRLVDIFRVYVFSKKGIHSLQKTTDDLVKQLKTAGLPEDNFERLSQSLSLSDLVKFAKYEPSAEDDERSFSTIKESIVSIQQQP